MITAAEERPVTAPPYNPDAGPNWRQHVDPRDRNHDPDAYDAKAPWLEQGRGPPGHNL